MTEAKCLELLKAIHQLALLPYPWPEGSEVAVVIPAALGEIAGIASRAIKIMEEG